MFCKNCGSEINPTELFCSKCGARVAETVSETSSEPVVSLDPEANPESVNPVTESAETVPVDESAEDSSSADSMAPVESGHELGVFGEVSHVGGAVAVKKPKRSKLKKRLLAIFLPIILIAAVAISVYANPVWRNSFLRMVMSEKTYFKYVMGTNIKDGITSISSDVKMIQNIMEGKNAVNAKMEIEIGDAGKDLIAKYAGRGASLAFSWFDNIGLSFDAGRTDDAYGLGLGLIINGNEAITADGVFTEDGCYVSVPELNDKAVYVSVGDNVDVSDISETLEKLGKLFPSEEVITDMMTRYALCIVNNVSDIDEKDITLTAGGVNQKAIGMTVKLDGKSLIKIAEACLKEAKKDNDIKNIIKEACESGVVQGEFDEVYKEFLQEIDDGLEGIKEKKNDPDFEEIEIFVRFIANKRGELIGMDITFDGGTIKYHNTQNGGKYGSLLAVEKDGQMAVSYESTGTVNDGKYNSEGTLSVMGMDIISVKTENIDKSKYDKGIFNGKVTVTPGDDASALLMMAPYDLRSVISELEIVIESSATEEYKGDLVVNANTDGEKICTLKFDYDITGAPNYTVPDSYIDASNDSKLHAWGEECLKNIARIKELMPIFKIILTGE